MADHIHILAVLKPNAAVSDSVRGIKANSSRWLRRDCGLGNRFGWQGGYGAFSVSKSQVERVRKYIEGQERHHARQTFEDELVGLLRAHGIAFEERYLWDRGRRVPPASQALLYADDVPRARARGYMLPRAPHAVRATQRGASR